MQSARIPGLGYSGGLGDHHLVAGASSKRKALY